MQRATRLFLALLLREAGSDEAPRILRQMADEMEALARWLRWSD